MTAETLQLLRLLVEAEAAFLPFRFPSTPTSAATAIVERRAAYHRAGLPFTGGGTEAARQGHSRLVQRLRAADLVVLYGRGRARTGRLTSRGLDFAAAMVPFTPLATAWPLLEQIASMGAGMILEHDILGTDAPSVDTALQIEDLALPLLIRGFLHSWGDSVGSIGYRATDAGRAALFAGLPDPPENLPRYLPPADIEQYMQMFHAALDARDNWKPAAANHVAVPRSAGLWRRPEATSV